MCRYLLSLLFRLVDADGSASSDLDLSSSPILFLFVCVRVFRVRALAPRKTSEPLRSFQGSESTEVLQPTHFT